jgi:primosomal protein N' (replication factor Y) (superfamily II helicase)
VILNGRTRDEEAAPAAARRVEVALLLGRRAPQTLIYAMPDHLAEHARPGTTVVVPLGTRRVTGVILEITEAEPPGRIREVADVLSEALPAELLELALWAARYYRAPRGSLLQAVLPPAVRRSRRRQIVPVESMSQGDDKLGSARSPLDREILARLPAGGLALDAIRQEFGEESEGALRRLRARGLVRIEDVEIARRDPRHAPLTSIPGIEPSPRARRQVEIHRFVAERAPAGVAREAIEQAFPGSAAIVARMLAASLLAEVAGAPSGAPVDEGRLDLHPEQRAAIEAIDAAQATFAPFLLHGVTGSGKTEVYLAAAARALARGSGVLVLVPEIGLTPQLVEQARSRFGEDTHVLHSSLSEAERARVWRDVVAAPAAVVVGARSAVFAPIRGLGLIVVDEEHDSAYKQDESPRYHARDVAVMRAKGIGCPVVLASATPSLESYEAARRGRYRLLELPLRANRSALPAVELIDLRTKGPSPEPPADDAKTRSPLSRTLCDAIVENHRAGAQTLLFLNRRGFARFIQCESCGHVETCPHCSVSLTFHRSRRATACHHCGFAKPPATRCPSCSAPLAARSFGTEQVEADVRALLPEARVARLDSDTGSSPRFLRETLASWRRGDLDILVGTQIVAKGHDAPGVTLIGVVLADTALSFPDFRAAERTFQLLAQVAGRAGRGDRPGRVLVQTRQPDHPSLVAARRHDYAAFAEGELALRSLLLYPPFGRLARVLVEGSEIAAVEQRAELLAERLRRGTRAVEGDVVEVLGPAPAALERLRGRHRHQVLVKASSAPRLAALLRGAALEDGGTSAVRVVVDVDPISML